MEVDGEHYILASLFAIIIIYSESTHRTERREYRFVYFISWRWSTSTSTQTISTLVIFCTSRWFRRSPFSFPFNPLVDRLSSFHFVFCVAAAAAVVIVFWSKWKKKELNYIRWLHWCWTHYTAALMLALGVYCCCVKL